MNSGLFLGKEKSVWRRSVSPTIKWQWYILRLGLLTGSQKKKFGYSHTMGFTFKSLSHVSDFALCSTSLHFLLLCNIYPAHSLTLASTTFSQLIPLSSRPITGTRPQHKS